MRTRRWAQALAAGAVAALLWTPVPGSAVPASPHQEGDDTTTTAEPPDPEAAAERGNLEIRLMEAPVEREDDPRARVYVIDHLAPGTAITRGVELTNNTGEPLAVRTYGGGAVLGEGDFHVLDEAPESQAPVGSGAGAVQVDAARELADWITVDPRTREIAPGQVAAANATITVPPDAAPGERYGVIWAEMRSEDPEGMGVTQVNRVGIRVYLSVGEGNEPASDFTIGDTRVDRGPDNGLRATASVRNTGGRALDLTGELALSDGPGGVSAGPLRTDGATTLAVGELGTVSVPLSDRLAPGDWEARLTVRSGETERTHTNGITIPGPVAQQEEGESLPVSTMAGAGGGGLLLLGLLAVATRRIRRGRHRPAHAA